MNDQITTPPSVTHMGCTRRAVNRVLLLTPFLLISDMATAEKIKGKPIRIIALGDSLTAGYGLRPGQSFPDLLQIALRQRGHDVEIVNGGVSGDTTAAGLARLDWAIDETADAVIVELGANDALRGQPTAETRANLDAILTRLSQRGLPLLVAGMRAPSNWGTDYREAFDAIFADLAAKHAALLYPFFLDGVATDPKLNLDDGLHPNARGIAMIVERILPTVEQLIARVATEQRSNEATTPGKS